MQSSVPRHSPQKRSLIGEYLAFLKAPSYEKTPGTLKGILSKIWRLYSVNVLLLIPMVLLIQLSSMWIVSIEDNKIAEQLSALPPYQFIFLAVVLAPLTEELFFRLPLRFSKFNLALPLTFLLFALGAPIIVSVGHQGIGLLIWLSMICLAILFCTQGLERIGTRKGERFFSRHFRVLVYGSSILFGLLHITNYPHQAWIVAPLLVLPQTTLGLLLAYVRTRFGFLWAIYTHGLHNFLVSSPLLFTAFGSEQFRKVFFEQATEVELLPQDKIVGAFYLLWIIGISAVVLTTAIKLIREWQQERKQAAAS